MAAVPDSVPLDAPLCVDLDGTLVKGDMLVEGLLALATDWRIVPSLYRLLRGGRAVLKQHVARLAPVDAASLPYNDALLDFLRAEKARGRRLVLATAADRGVAESIAAHLGIFDEIIASDGERNLKGSRKAAALIERFGRKGFAYAGNDAADLAVWREAAAAIIVNAPAAVAAAASALVPVERRIEDRAPRLRSMVRAMRPHQWLKNLLVFVPILTAHALGEVGSWVNAALAFAALSATASAIYIVNDLTDLAADRRHPRKRRRPFASGALDPVSGGIMAAFLLTLGIGLGHACGVLPVLAVYAACSLSYSFKLKELPLVDIFTLAALYTLRLFAGGEATGHLVSLWLLGFSSFLFLSLAALKRVEELMALAQRSGRQAARRGYLAEDAAILQMFGCCAAFMSSVVLALFVQNEAAAQQYASPALLWATVPLILFWECRLWLSTARGYMHDDPIVYAARDWVSWLVAAAVTIILIAARFPW